MIEGAHLGHQNTIIIAIDSILATLTLVFVE
jgi:hypothetical protein